MPSTRRPARSVRSASLVLSVLLFASACGGGGGEAPPPPPPPVAAVITVQPADQAVGAGATATFAVTATGATGYQWQRSAPGGGVFADVAGATGSAHTTPATTLADDGARYRVVVGGAAGPVTSSAATLTVTAVVVPPPDPSAAAPANDLTVATDLFASVQFLWTGPNPVQPGVSPWAIDSRRLAVLRGEVRERDGAPVAGVRVSVLGEPRLGWTLTRADGTYDLAVNGGGQLTLAYEKEGFLVAHRAVVAPWRDWARVAPVGLVAPDATATLVTLGASAPQLAVGSEVADADGARQAAVLVPSGTTAELVLPGGGTAPLSGATVRATEFTVGAGGPDAMPGPLPPTSGYTYAVELSVDEAQAAGATSVRFSRPLPVYLENFLGFAVGTPVPAGWYDRERAVWVPSENGRVVAVAAVSGGVADLDTDGDGLADDDATLAALGVDAEERAQLGRRYVAGQTLWRVPVVHFTPWDFNWPFGPPEGALGPDAAPLAPEQPDDPSERCGSVIGCETQSLGEEVPVAGTGWSLHYRSERTPGHLDARTLRLRLTGATVPPPLLRIEVKIGVAGRTVELALPPGPNLVHPFVFDGLDAYGRVVQGMQPVTVEVGYVYPGVYMTPAQRSGAMVEEQLFGHFSYAGSRATADATRREVTLWRTISAQVGWWDARAAGLGGWSLSAHHAFDPYARTLYLGDGRQRRASATTTTITTVAGSGLSGVSGDGGPATQARFASPRNLAVGPDGSLYVSDQINNRIRKVAPDGIITTVAGIGNGYVSGAGFSGDGGLATEAMLQSPRGICVGADGSLYIADYANQRIRRVGPDGIITTFAGTGVQGFSGDGGPATAAAIYSPEDVAVGPDGSVFIADSGNHRVRRVSPDGVISTYAGGDNYPNSGEGRPATEGWLSGVQSLQVGPDGVLYFVDFGAFRVKAVGTDGRLRTVAGGGPGYPDPVQNGVPATSVALNYMYGLDLAPDGSLLVTEGAGHRVRRVRNGLIDTVAGGGPGGATGDGLPATAAYLPYANDVVLARDGSGFFLLDDTDRVRKVTFALGLGGGADLLVPSEDGAELYAFSVAGRHLRTLDALTGAVRLTFAYDGAGRLASVTDASGNVVAVERTGGAPSAIVAPGGLRTTLEVDGAGWLSRVTDPAGSSHALAASASGLLGGLTDPRGHAHAFAYDALGRLVLDTDPAGGSTALARVEVPYGYEVTTTTALGRTQAYRVEHLPDGTRRRTVTSPSGAVSVALRRTDGSEQTTLPDGSTVEVAYGPDPRWGLAAPVATRTVTRTPAGLERVVTRSRTVALADAADLLSVTALTETVNDAGAVSTFAYASGGGTRTTTETSAGGQVRTRKLDALGRVVEERRGGLEATAYTYDDAGRLVAAVTGPRTTAFRYDASNRLTGFTDPTGRSFDATLDAAGRPTSLTVPGAGAVAQRWDASGNLTSVTPPGRGDHLLTWTPRDELAGYTPPAVAGASTSWSWSWDADRELAGLTRPAGTTATFTRDEAGRLTGVALPRGTIAAVHDDADRLASVADPGGVALAWAYDGPLVASATWSGAVTGDVTWSYDPRGLVIGEAVSGAAPVTFNLDGDGLITAAAGLSLTRDLPTGLLTGTAVGAVTEAWTHDAFGAPASHAASHGATPLYQATWSRDALDRIVGVTETILGTTTTRAFAYDPAGRLVTVSEAGAPVRAYGYDANGNRTSSTGPAATATHDAQDRLLTQGAATYTHGAGGERTSRTQGGQVTAYDFDLLGQLLGVALPDGRLVEYLQDGTGRRAGKKVDGVQVKGWLWASPLRPLAELDGTGAVVSRFVYATRQNVPDLVLRGGATYRVITDHLGSPRLVVDAATGAVAQRLDYDELGRVLLDTNPGFQPFGFAGGLYDPDTGLVRFGAREYDAETGRFLSKDPTLFWGGDTNLYAYAGGDPVNRVDPDGLSDVSCLPLYIRTNHVRLWTAPSSWQYASYHYFRGGDVFQFNRLDPTGQWVHVTATLPGGGQVSGWTLTQNLSKNPPPEFIPGEGRPMPAQAFASSGAATKA